MEYIQTQLEKPSVNQPRYGWFPTPQSKVGRLPTLYLGWFSSPNWISGKLQILNFKN